MRTTSRFMLAVLMGFAAAVVVAAQEVPPLSLQAAISIALENRPVVQAAQCEVTAAAAAARAARVLPNPLIVITPTLIGETGADQTLFMAQPLETNGVKQARSRIAAGKMRVAMAGAVVTRRDVVRNVKTAYWSAVQACALQAFDADNVQLTETLVKAAERQVELGNAPAAQAMKAEMELARMRQQLVRAKAAVSQADATLNTVMGRPPATPLNLSDALTFTPLALQEDLLLKCGLAQRPEMAQAGAGIDVAHSEVEMARTLRRPDLALQFIQGDEFGSGGVGLAITIPLIDWGYAKAERARAEANVCVAEKRLEETRNAVRLDISLALISARSAEAQVREYREQILTPAEKLSQMALLGYQEGATSYLEVLEARRTLRAVNTEYLTALGDYQKALAQLEWAAGVDALP